MGFIICVLSDRETRSRHHFAWTEGKYSQAGSDGFWKRGDGMLRYQSRLCATKVDELQNRIMD